MDLRLSHVFSVCDARAFSMSFNTTLKVSLRHIFEHHLSKELKIRETNVKNVTFCLRPPDCFTFT